MKRCSESLNLSLRPGNTHIWTSPESPSGKNLLSQPFVPSSLSFLPPTLPPLSPSLILPFYQKEDWPKTGSFVYAQSCSRKAP